MTDAKTEDISERLLPGVVDVELKRTHLSIFYNSPDEIVLKVTIGGVTHRSIPTCGVVTVAISYEGLYQTEILAPRIIAQHMDGREEVLPNPPLLQQIDIRNSAEFSQRVQSLSLRMTDKEAVRFASRRLLSNEKYGFADRAAALCALGYRIVETNNPNDSDILFLKEEANKTLAQSRRNEKYARWVTSITMMLTYVAVLLRSAEDVEDYLNETLSYRPFLPQLSLLHTNFSRSNLLLALIRASRNDFRGAAIALEDIKIVLRTGVKYSWIDHHIQGRSQFSEIVAVLKVVKLATAIHDDLKRAATEYQLSKYAQSVAVGGVAPMLKGLQLGGHWSFILNFNSDSKVAAANLERSKQ